MASSQTIHIFEYRTSPPPPPPPDTPAPITAPLTPPNPNSYLDSRNDLNRSLGLGQTLDVLV